ncbi:hydroxymethylglutaryl-CoA lyase [Halobacillus andaensis]|uniref:Hydroxymethylglutaryl-CoA lyase n=1 Tax=Halobacillus andaensis TaxID=1176239 RepID=A0A917B0R3_HALAA|nr:hydroxymethylglutaryl-CoA lyase [Halobacillus andaensis]MBP2003366.1 hydroxymethylglutaryl-CoA lyase [Halobacillus andaensis]GGF10094.1 hydroxymethylglutaryl-CoA lyase [Halobacillus andaensis]
MGGLPEFVTVKEVGPRDGLQNEAEQIPTEIKVEWMNLLSEAGYSSIEFSSFVHPKWIPQLKDAKQVAQQMTRNPNITYAALVPNRKGLEAALEADIDEVAVFMSASETHNLKNINKTIEDTFPVLKEVIEEAKHHNKRVRGYVSTVFGCPYEGEVRISQVLQVCQQLIDMGVDEISLGDTIGVADPLQVEQFLKTIEGKMDFSRLAMHFHNTHGMALANTLVSLKLGITIFDSSLGGLGGCPYAKGASGNLATDDLVHMLHKMGIQTGIHETKLKEAALFIQQAIQKELPSHQMQIYNRMDQGEGC